MMKPTTPATREQTTRNIDLAFQMIEEAIERPSLVEEIPDGATVVLMPFDDPELAQRNLSLAMRLAEAGKTVVLHRVGVPTADVPAWQGTELNTVTMRSISPHWPSAPPNAAAWIITYDEEHDDLIVDLYGRQRKGIDLPIHRTLSLWVDPETEEIMGYVIPRFVHEALPRQPHLARLLAHATDVLTSDKPAEMETPSSLTDEVGHLIA